MRVLYKKKSLEELAYNVVCPKCGQINHFKGSDSEIKCENCGKTMFSTFKGNKKMLFEGPGLVLVPFNSFIPEEVQAYVVKGTYTDGTPILESVKGPVCKGSILYVGAENFLFEYLKIDSVGRKKLSTPLRVMPESRQISCKILKDGRFVNYKGVLKRNTIYLPK